MAVPPLSSRYLSFHPSVTISCSAFKFDIPMLGKYPFLEMFSHPIYCNSRNRSSQASSFTWKNSTSPVNLLNGSPSFGMDEGSPDFLHDTVTKAKQTPSLKRVKLGQQKTFEIFKVVISSDQANMECNSPVWTTNEGDNAYGTNLGS